VRRRVREASAKVRAQDGSIERQMWWR
jgi:hypothetical protein